MKNIVVLINGPAGAGKDTFIEMAKLVARMKYDDEHFTIIDSISAVDPIKDVARKLGWNGVKDETGRAALSDLKDYADSHFKTSMKYIFDNIDSKRADGYVRLASEPLIKSEAVPEVKAYITFVCVRESKDAKAIIEHYDDTDVEVFGVYITRDDITKVSSNHADIEAQVWDRECFPFLIRNVGTYGNLLDVAEMFLDGLLMMNELK